MSKTLTTISRTYGTISLAEGGKCWRISAEPHVLIRLKRMFEGVRKYELDKVTLSNTPEHCKDLEWFVNRYPLKISAEDKRAMRRGGKQWEDRFTRLNDILNPNYVPPTFALALPPRHYQSQAAAMHLSQGSLLLTDDLGLGKTCTAICAMTDPRTLPAIVVCYPHLQKQWEREIIKFAPSLYTHVIKSTEPYELPKLMDRSPDVLITTYHKLDGWGDVLAKYGKSITFDEAQELRRGDSKKYTAAKAICRRMRFKLGLTATPIYNYGGEMFAVLDCLAPGCLGDRQEFHREWCTGIGDKAAIREPEAFGAYLREQGLMLRRTRKEVGRELPPVIRVTHGVESDIDAIDAVADKAGELARIIVNGGSLERGEAMQAAGEFDAMMRQATGIAKAPYVAEFVKLLATTGKPVVLCGWHHAVYQIWSEQLKDLRIWKYTGEQTPKAKDEARTAMINGDVDVLILSLRSGAGLDGLQEVCDTIVFGELDWSPGVHEQCIGRLHRDGQNGDVKAYFLTSDSGADPIMSRVLGLKRDQVDGIRDPNGALFEKLDRSGEHLKELAREYLARKHKVREMAESAGGATC